MEQKASLLFQSEQRKHKFKLSMCLKQMIYIKVGGSVYTMKKYIIYVINYVSLHLKTSLIQYELHKTKWDT